MAGGPERRRWFDVLVSTDNGEYEGKLRLPSGRSALQELIDGEQAYLGLWNARRPGAAEGEYLVLHKSTIRYITIGGGAAEPIEETA